MEIFAKNEQNKFMYKNNFYNSLNKPSFNPPSVIFQIVWPILYLLMFVSLYLIFNSDSPLRNWAVWVFGIQLLLNILWSPVFFIFEKMRVAFLISLLLTLSVLFMVLIFFQISIVAGLLQIPYFLWLCFATVLNLCFIILNPEEKV